MAYKDMKTILVVEDDQEVLAMLLKNLKHLGYEVIQAVDGMEGLRKIETEQFDLVITDIVMPFISGLGVVSALKRKKPEIPVIAITGFGKEPEAAAVEKNADLVLSKPVRISRLNEEIRKLLAVSKKG